MSRNVNKFFRCLSSPVSSCVSGRLLELRALVCWSDESASYPVKHFAIFLFSLLLGGFVTAKDAGVGRILARYQAIRPATKDLGMYRLDWADSLDVALKRAAKENRPVCLIIIHAKYGDIASGHC